MSSRIKPIFGPKHREYIRSATQSTISVAEGAVRAGKTIDNITAFAYLLDKGPPDRIHLATGATAANAKLNIGDANGFGLEAIFRGRCRWTKYKGNEALVIKSHGREYAVIFAGGGKADSYKKIRGNSYGMWIATEINLHHQDTIQEAFNRQLAARLRRVFWDLNPSSPAAWIYEDYIDQFPQQFGDRYNYQHFTIRDNATITPQRLAEIEAQYDPQSIWYRRDILGQRCVAEGLVYPMFDPGRHILQKPVETEGECYVSCDFGIQNATTFGLWQREKGSDRWVRLREFVYSGRQEKRQKTVAELADGLIGMLDGVMPKQVILDPSAAALKVELRRRGFHTRDADNDVLNGISDVCSLLGHDKLAFSATCRATIAEFGDYRWNEKSADQGQDVPLKENDHCMDDIRYFCRTLRLAKRDGKKPVRPVWR